MVRTPRGTDIATSREGILRRAADSKQFELAFRDPQSKRPLSLCCDDEGNIYFGQYFSNESRNPISIFQSQDDGRTFRECYRFSAGEVRHVHGLIYDRFRNMIWVLTGDYGNEAKIALATPGFQNVRTLAQGTQQTRACDGICTADRFVYATDTPLEQNHVVHLDPQSGESENVAKIQNSVLFMGEACGGAFLSTIVEPSELNSTRNVHIWFSSDNRAWQEVISIERDRWSLRYFQYPMASFAFGPRECPYSFVNFRGVRGHDGDCVVLERAD
jgi:hypothetical protein